MIRLGIVSDQALALVALRIPAVSERLFQHMRIFGDVLDAAKCPVSEGIGSSQATEQMGKESSHE